MSVIPMKEDVGQEIYTRDHGVVKVDKTSWMDGRFHIVLCPNGAYQHMNGLPINNEAEIHEAFGRDEEGNCPNEEAKQKCLNWFRNRHEQEGKAPRPIGMHPDGYPIFDDGTVPDFDDLYAYFRPGKGLTGMIVALQDYKDRTGSEPPKELRKPVEDLGAATWPGKQELGPEAIGGPAPSRVEYEKLTVAENKRLEALRAKERIRAAKNRAKKAKSKAARPAPAPPQG